MIIIKGSIQQPSCYYYVMQEIRIFYKQAHNVASKNPQNITLNQCKKMLTLADNQYQQMVNINDYNLLDELTFYHDRFQKAVNLLQSNKDLHGSSTRSQINAIFRQNPPMTQVTPAIALGQESQKFDRQGSNKQQISKDFLSKYFNEQSKQIQRSTVGFKSVLEDMNRVPIKYKIKVTPPVTELPRPKKDEPQKLKSELRKLRKQLKQLESQKDFNVGISEAEKAQYQQQIEDLKAQIASVNRQNTFLKEKSMLHKTVSNYNETDWQNKTATQMQRKVIEINPYSIDYRPNNIQLLKTEADRPRIEITPARKDYEIPQLSLPTQINFQLPEDLLAKQTFQEKTNERKPIDSHHKQKTKVAQVEEKNSGIVRSNIKFNGSQVKDKAKNIAIRSKISYFKQSMVLYRGSSFDVAVKSADIVKLISKRVRIFCNNRQKTIISPQLAYKYDSRYYNLVMKKKMGKVAGGDQSYEEVEVTLLSQKDIDNIIEVQLTVESKKLHFLLPTMFIDFVQRRPPKQQNNYETVKINPIHQASSLGLVEEILPLQRIHSDEETGRLFGVSRRHEGYISFRWLQGVLQIETIRPWKLFFSYLLLRDC